MNRPELLAPAGNWECVKAAVSNGADAIYFGLPRFNARLRADNFTEEDLPELLQYVHARGVKAYVTMNTLIFSNELAEAERFLILLSEQQVDAIIVQDIGLVQLARQVAPSLAVHASTQMTLTSPEGVQFAQKLGVARAVLARELSLRELEKFHGSEILPLEVFVHGALCVAYSGQCLTSEALGQRSANRGECAQACRLPYQLVVDGVIKDLGDQRYLLSPQDLAAVAEVPRLMQLGVVSFKIEGRLKSPEYVAAVTQVYRRAIDACLAESREDYPVSAGDRYQLEMAFSRGLYSGWLHGVNHQELVHARFGKKRGAFVGRIEEVGSDHVTVALQIPLNPGDGVVFDTGGDTNQEQGGRVYQVRGQRLYFAHNKIDFTQLKPGDRVWKTDDPQLDKELRHSFSRDLPVKGQKLTVAVSGSVGAPLNLTLRQGDFTATLQSQLPLQVALKQPLTAERLREQLGRLGGTAYQLAELTVDLPAAVILPVSELNRMRREMVALLDARQTKAAPVVPAMAQLSHLLRKVKQSAPLVAAGETLLTVTCRNNEQIDAALDCGIRHLYIDFEDIRRYPDAVTRVHDQAPEVAVFLATPRIQKAGEQGFFKLIENARPDGVLIRNLGGLSYFKDSPLRKAGDFSLNVANPLTAGVLMQEGFEWLTLSYDLNAGQVMSLLDAAPPAWFELTLHQHMPMFHMEHCVFAAFLSEGKDFMTCGRPCDRHEVKLRDRIGAEHPLKADVGCRNTVFHQRAQSGALYYSDFYRAGLRRYRLEFLNEDAAQTGLIIRAYQQLLAGQCSGADLTARLKVQNQLGVTSGTLTVLT